MIRLSLITILISGLFASEPALNPQLGSPRLGRPSGDDVAEPITFEWQGVPDAAGYIFELLRGDKADPFMHEELNGLSVVINSLPPGRYLWRVRAVDAKKAVGPWSAQNSFEPMSPQDAAQIVSVAIVPSVVSAGAPCDGMVTIDKPAPPKGLAVRLTSTDDELASVPDHAVVSEGMTSASFRVFTGNTKDGGTVHITASGILSSRTATLDVRPPAPPGQLASLTLHPMLLASGGTAVGTVTLTTIAPGPDGVDVLLDTDNNEELITVPPYVTVAPGMVRASFAIEASYTSFPHDIGITASLLQQREKASVTVRSAAHFDPLDAPADLHAESERGIAVLRWTPVMGASSYTVQFDTAASLDSENVLQRTLPEGEQRIERTPRTEYFWRVRANDEYGSPGRWSGTVSLYMK